MKTARIVLAGAIVFSGCAAPKTMIDVPADHPANPTAAEAPAPPESATLSLDSIISPATKPPGSEPHHHPRDGGGK